MPSGVDQIADDEELYRRVPACYFPNGIVSDQAFAPHKERDTTGLSLFRAQYKRIEDLGKPGKTHCVAVLRAGDIRAAGMTIVARPDIGNGQFDLAHVEVPELNSAAYKTTLTQERQRRLLEMSRIIGPITCPP